MNPLGRPPQVGDVIFYFEDYSHDSMSVVMAAGGRIAVATAGAVIIDREAMLELSIVLQTALEGDEAELHLILFDDHGWTIQHAAGCRRHGLFTCPYTSAANSFSHGQHPFGRFEIGLDDAGSIVVKEPRP